MQWHAGLACLGAMCLSGLLAAKQPPSGNVAASAIPGGGTWIASPQFDDAKEFSEGLAAVKIGKLWGYIDQTGKVVINPSLEGAGRFQGGLAIASVRQRKTEKYGFIDRTGAFAIPPQYEELSNFSEGLALVCEQPFRPCGFIDEKGTTVIAPRYEIEPGDDFRFNGGLAKVVLSRDTDGNTKDGFIDKTGAVVLRLDFGVSKFTEGLARAIIVRGKNDTVIGYIDVTGKMVIAPQFDGARAFTNGLACVRKQGKGWGLIDRTGSFVIDPQYDESFSFTPDGLAVVKKGRKWGYIDATGRVVVPLQYKDIWPFTDGMGAVYDGGWWGFVDRSGAVAIQPQYVAALPFIDGLAAVKAGRTPVGNGKKLKWGFIDKAGNAVIASQFDGIAGFSDGIAVVRQGNKFGYVTR